MGKKAIQEKTIANLYVKMYTEKEHTFDLRGVCDQHRRCAVVVRTSVFWKRYFISRRINGYGNLAEVTV